MQRPAILISLLAAVGLFAFWLLLETPGSLNDALSHPFHMMVGTERQLHSKLLEVSETGEPVRTAGRRLLQPLGVLRLNRTYDAPEPDAATKP